MTTPTCDPATGECGDSCIQLDEADDAICAPGCSPFSTACPPGSQCQGTGDGYNCVPP